MYAFHVDPWHMPCEECGESVAREHRETHVCDEGRRELYRLRRELAGLESELAAFLASPEGRFELWYAERERLRRAS
jgi:hypothetical protein